MSQYYIFECGYDALGGTNDGDRTVGMWLWSIERQYRGQQGSGNAIMVHMRGGTWMVVLGYAQGTVQWGTGQWECDYDALGGIEGKR